MPTRHPSPREHLLPLGPWPQDLGLLWMLSLLSLQLGGRAAGSTSSTHIRSVSPWDTESGDADQGLQPLRQGC